MQFVNGVLEIEPSEQGIRRDFGGAEYISSAIGFDGGRNRIFPPVGPP